MYVQVTPYMKPSIINAATHILYIGVYAISKLSEKFRIRVHGTR
jgi:hypothetical protein